MTGVLLVMSWRPTAVGGVTTAVVNLRQEFERSGSVTADLLVEMSEYPTLRTEVIDGRKVYLLRVASPYYKGRGTAAALGFIYRFARTARELLRLIRDCKITVVNVHFPGLEAVLWGLLVRLGLFRGQLVLSFHGADVTLAAAGKSLIEEILWNFSVRASTGLTACSAMLARELTGRFPFAVSKIHVIPNGVSADNIISEASSFDQLHAPLSPYIVCIGGFEPKKGLDVLLRAFAVVTKVEPRLTLALLCRSGPDLAATHALIGELKLADRVYLQIDCPHPRAMGILKGAEALVVPSRKEPFGIVVLEAAVLARPIVLTSACGVLESLPQDIPVSVVPPDDAAALASSIIAVLQDREAASDGACVLRSYVIDSLTWSSAAAKFLSVYRMPAFPEAPFAGPRSR